MEGGLLDFHSGIKWSNILKYVCMLFNILKYACMYVCCLSLV